MSLVLLDPSIGSSNLGDDIIREGVDRALQDVLRIGLVRALYTEPKLLLLDEATSSLDTETEHAVTEVITELYGEVTTVVIAHRLSTVLHSNLVLYLEDGVSIASGTFAEVRAAAPRLERQARLCGL